MNKNIDEVDRKILEILQEDCRIPYKKIAEKLNIPKSTVHSRVQKLLKNGVIERCVAILNPRKVGYSKIAWMGLTVEPEKIENITKKLVSYDEVQVVATAHGHHDIILQVVAKDSDALGDFINNRIKTIEGVKTGVGMMHVSMFLNIYKNTHKLPV